MILALWAALAVAQVPAGSDGGTLALVKDRSLYVLRITVRDGGLPRHIEHAYASLAPFAKAWREYVALPASAHELVTGTRPPVLWVIQRGRVVQRIDLKALASIRYPSGRVLPASDESQLIEKRPPPPPGKLIESNTTYWLEDVPRWKIELAWEEVERRAARLEGPLLSRGQRTHVVGSVGGDVEWDDDVAWGSWEQPWFEDQSAARLPDLQQ